MILLEKLKLAQNFSTNEQEVATYLLNNLDHIKNMNTQTIAKETYTSAATVIRLSKKCGFMVG